MDILFLINLIIFILSPFVITNKYERIVIDIVETIHTIIKRIHPSCMQNIGIELMSALRILIIIIPLKTFLK